MIKNIKQQLIQYIFIKRIYYIYKSFFLIVKLLLKFSVRLLLGRYIKSNKNSYPKTVQLPITFKCNFDCVMCGMRNLIHKDGFSKENFKKIFSDELFKEVESVGINGGEPFLEKNLIEYIEILIEKLPKLKNIYIITNGYFSEIIVEKSKIIKKLCELKGIKYHLSVSIDGIGEMQNIMRGNKNAFEKVTNTSRLINKEKDSICDSFGGICTITKVNVYNLPELECWVEKEKIPMNFNIATIHKRICNDYKYEDFSVFTDKHAQMLASEFFYTKFLQTKSEYYFSLYYVTKFNKRISKCSHQYNVVTITPDGELAYCATHSDCVGNCNNSKPVDIFFNPENLKYREKMHNEYCDSCSHYNSSIQAKYYKLFIKEMLWSIKNYV